MHKTLPFALTLLVLAPAARAAGDAAAGRDIARLWCTECHTVEPEPTTSAVDTAPPFTAIAKSTERTSSYVRAWLFDPHPPMPKLRLTRREIEDLAAYIDSLRAD